MEANYYLKHYDVNISPGEKKKVILAMEDYKNQTQILFEAPDIKSQFLEAWNNARKAKGMLGKMRVIDTKAMSQTKQLLKAGYSIKDIIQAFENATKDKWHKETAYKYVTPEYITRPNQFNKYLNAADQRDTETGDYAYQ